MIANYHTHTSRCMHATGTDEDYVIAAAEAQMFDIGFSDHAPWPFQNGYVSPIRMPMEALDGYISSIRELKYRYESIINVELGLEAEYFPRYHDHLLRMRDMGIEYYILGQHYVDSEEDHPYVARARLTEKDVYDYANAVVKGIRTGLFRYVAHPDLFLRHYEEEQLLPCHREAIDMICQAAKEANMPLEYNLLGMESQLIGDDRGYPSPLFWYYARKWDNKVIIGVDAHKPESLNRPFIFKLAENRLSAMGYRTVERLY